MKFEFTKIFLKQFQSLAQNKPNLDERVTDVIEDFKKNIFNSEYYRHPLSGYKEDIHELSCGGDYRIVIQLIKEKDTWYFINF